MGDFCGKRNRLFSLTVTLPKEEHICFSNANNLKIESLMPNQYCPFSEGLLHKWKAELSVTGAETIESYLHLSSSVHFSSLTQLCPTLCNPMDFSTPGLHVHHQLPEFTQTHVP